MKPFIICSLIAVITWSIAYQIMLMSTSFISDKNDVALIERLCEISYHEGFFDGVLATAKDDK